jgi:hypothetical protein
VPGLRAGKKGGDSMPGSLRKDRTYRSELSSLCPGTLYGTKETQAASVDGVCVDIKSTLQKGGLVGQGKTGRA